MAQATVFNEELPKPLIEGCGIFIEALFYGSRFVIAYWLYRALSIPSRR